MAPNQLFFGKGLYLYSLSPKLYLGRKLKIGRLSPSDSAEPKDMRSQPLAGNEVKISLEQEFLLQIFLFNERLNIP